MDPDRRRPPHADGCPRAGASRTVVLVVDRPIPGAAVTALVAEVAARLTATDVTAVVCDVGGLRTVDATTVDALARCQLTARRLGHVIRLRRPSVELVELLAMIGLCQALPLERPERPEPDDRD